MPVLNVLFYGALGYIPYDHVSSPYGSHAHYVRVDLHGSDVGVYVPLGYRRAGCVSGFFHYF